MEWGGIRVRRQIARINEKVVEAPLKTKNAYCTLPLAENTINILKSREKSEHLSKQPSNRMLRKGTWSTQLKTQKQCVLRILSGPLFPPAQNSVWVTVCVKRKLPHQKILELAGDEVPSSPTPAHS